MRSPHLYLTLLGLVGIIASCQPGGTPSSTSHIDIPTAWKATGKSSSRSISSGWVKDFNDPQLSRLVGEAMQRNPDLLATAERLEAARANVTQSRARRMPSVNLSASGSRTRLEDGGPGSNGASYTSSQGVNIGASWEIDLWGRLRHLHTAAQADYDSTVADFRGTRLSLAASTSSAWYNLITSENQRKLSEETLGRYRKVEKIIERNYKAGTARSLDLQLSRNNVYNEERTLRARNRDRDDARRNLEIILGRYPKGEIKARTALPVVRKDVPAGLPADLITRRPDLVRAQQRLYASFHRAKAAQKNLLPAIRLTGSSGSRSPDISDLIDIDQLVSSITASLSQSIFEGGALKAEAEAAVAQNRAAIYDFANVALRAFREVESALAAEESLAQQEHFQRKSLEQASLAEKQAGRDYAEGVEGTDIISLLEAQRRASNARNSLILLQNQRIQNRINLHLALGGDFRSTAK
ncbi:efflux transporter outer membrane subunit [Verrucomicrobiaceae bacterium N1E253]|uniref:Efflux transporter outer membrane subunit n=1 Tax=Oceaniferula marina TaxID=2748318 RepID=A0A851GIA0_9BACT|nr:efflux transporter outer membrane subunit [Oceaniferula marina]NWK54857.1 efflux transporter outer membrane subunit [Oceaniferula marina]